MLSGREVVPSRVRRLDISPAYRIHCEALMGLLENFEAQGEVLYRGRNTVKKMQLENAVLVVKSFRALHGFRALLYGRFRQSKALRSFQNAQRLRRLNIETPVEVAVCELGTKGRLRSSYYVSEYYPHDFPLSKVFPESEGGSDPREARDVIEAFTQFTFQLHEAGVLHMDHNTGNTLVRKGTGGWTFAIIDINRMRFGALTLRQRLHNLVRLTDDVDTLLQMARTYAVLAGEAPERCERLLLTLKNRHWRRLAFKRRIQRILGKRRG